MQSNREHEAIVLEWLASFKLDPYAYRVYWVIRQHLRNDGACEMSVDDIANEAGISPRRARQAFVLLEEHALLIRYFQNQRPTIYELHWPNWPRGNASK